MGLCSVSTVLFASYLLAIKSYFQTFKWYLLALYVFLCQLEQLRAEGCLFYTIMYDPRTGDSEVNHIGIPDSTIESVTGSIKIHFPLLGA